jgi:acetyl-CoA decarbonylase/synthase complex subunit gamma
VPTAMEIYKLLPKKNCGECKFPTCLAFAMQLANKKAAIDDCPYIDDAAKSTLQESGAPPIRLIRFGPQEMQLEIGDETELFRHDKKFYHPTVLAVSISDSMAEEEQERILLQAKKLEFERAGQKLKLDALALRNDTGKAEKLEGLARRVMEKSRFAIILLGNEPESLRSAALACKDRRPVIGTANKKNLIGMISLAKEINLPLIVRADSLEELAELSTKAKESGLQDIILDLTRGDLASQLRDLTIVRRMAVKSSFRPFGYPTLTYAGSGEEAVARATLGIAKYSSIVVLDTVDPAVIYPLMTLRQSIFTDPQVPLQVQEKLYAIGSPKPESPLLLTTNFALTYFTVAGDIEKSGVSSWLLVANTEGLSVMTAFAAGKFTPESVAKLILKLGIKDKCTSGAIIIPGMVSRMSGKLNELTGLKVIVGPRESSGIPKFLKTLN